MPFSEQFIQDAICNPDRLTKVLGDLAKQWDFQISDAGDYVDVINQEVSFSGGVSMC